MIRIKELRNQNNLSLRDLANILDLSYSSLGKYERGEQQPNNETLIKIANYFRVSVDYLLNLTNVKTPNPDVVLISKYLGLTEQTINELHSYNKFASEGSANMRQKIQTINMLFEPNCELLENITAYLYFSATHFKNFYDNTDDSFAPIAELELWDDIAKEGYSDDWDLWSKAMLLIVEEELMHLRQRIQVKKLAKQAYGELPVDE